MEHKVRDWNSNYLLRKKKLMIKVNKPSLQATLMQNKKVLESINKIQKIIKCFKV